MKTGGRAGWPRPPAATTAAAALQLTRRLLVQYGWAQRCAHDGGRLDVLAALTIATGGEPPRPAVPSQIFLQAIDRLAEAMGYTGGHPIDALILFNDGSTDLEQVLALCDQAAAAALPLAALR